MLSISINILYHSVSGFSPLQFWALHYDYTGVLYFRPWPHTVLNHWLSRMWRKKFIVKKVTQSQTFGTGLHPVQPHCLIIHPLMDQLKWLLEQLKWLVQRQREVHTYYVHYKFCYWSVTSINSVRMSKSCHPVPRSVFNHTVPYSLFNHTVPHRVFIHPVLCSMYNHSVPCCVFIHPVLWSNQVYYTVKTYGLLQPYFGHLSCMPVV